MPGSGRGIEDGGTRVGRMSSAAVEKCAEKRERYEFVSGMFPWGCELKNSRPMAGIKLAACGRARSR